MPGNPALPPVFRLLRGRPHASLQRAGARAAPDGTAHPKNPALPSLGPFSDGPAAHPARRMEHVAPRRTTHATQPSASSIRLLRGCRPLHLIGRGARPKARSIAHGARRPSIRFLRSGRPTQSQRAGRMRPAALPAPRRRARPPASTMPRMRGDPQGRGGMSAPRAMPLGRGGVGPEAPDMASIRHANLQPIHIHVL